MSKTIFILIFLFLNIMPIKCQTCEKDMSLENANCFNEIKIFDFENKFYRAGHFALNKNGDMIIEYSYNESRLFYGISKNGRPYFNNFGNEIDTKEIALDKTKFPFYFRYESRNIFISDVKQEIEHLFSVSHYQATEIYNLRTGVILFYILYESDNQFKNMKRTIQSIIVILLNMYI